MVLDGPNVDSKVRKAARSASEMVWGPRSKGLSQKIYGVENVEVYIKGPGPGREAAIRAARNFFIVTGIYDMTGIPFNGVRAPNERRV